MYEHYPEDSFFPSITTKLHLKNSTKKLVLVRRPEKPHVFSPLALMKKEAWFLGTPGDLELKEYAIKRPLR